MEIPQDLQAAEIRQFTEEVLGDLAFTSDSPTIQELVNSLLWGVENRESLVQVVAPIVAETWLNWWAKNWWRNFTKD